MIGSQVDSLCSQADVARSIGADFGGSFHRAESDPRTAECFAEYSAALDEFSDMASSGQLADSIVPLRESYGVESDAYPLLLDIGVRSQTVRLYHGRWDEITFIDDAIATICFDVAGRP